MLYSLCRAGSMKGKTEEQDLDVDVSTSTAY